MHRLLLKWLRGQFRVCAIFISLLAVVTAPQSWGLGLGEIELDSALNQEFRAKIELIDVAGLEPSEILVSLGTAEDFQRIGVERFFFLTDLEFEVGYGASGAPVINVTSSKPITEPYLNFLVEVLWPNGRLLKEYTVLLDPPTFSEAAAPQVSAPAQNPTAASTGRVQRVEPAASTATTGTRVQMTPDREPTEPSPLDRGMSGGEYGMTDRDDTLWSIASRARPSSGVSVQQTMLAIQRMNPEAFINGNINLLKAGYVLRLPDEAEARALSAQEALGEVARHHSEWVSGKAGQAVARSTPAPVTDQTSELRSPVDASGTTTAATSAPATEGELRIVAEDGDSTTGVGGASSADLDAALEETDRLGRRVDELTYQLDREKEVATNEIAIRERQLEVKDQQIAELQAQLAAARQQAQAASAAPAPAPAADPAPQNQNQSTPAEATEPWWQSPIVMYGGAGVLVLLLVGGMLMARNRRAQEEENDYFDAEEAFAEEERHEPLMGEEDAESDANVIGPFAQDQDDDGFDEALDDAQTSDVIGEADIYIAYGRYPQAVSLLTGVLEDEPDRNDVRLKLLEVYSETGERAEFDTHMAALNEYCTDDDALETARELESRFGEEPVSLDDMMSEVAAPPPENDEVSGASTDEVDDDRTVFAGLSLDGDEAATEEVPLAAAEAEDAGEKEASALDFELELDDLGGEAETTAEVEEAGEEEARDGLSAGAGDQLGGDLGINFNPDEEATAEVETEADAEAEATSEEETAGAAIEFETAGSDEDFSATEELTIDADLEQAAATISGEAAELEASDVRTERAAEDEDLALKTEARSEAETLLDDLDLETAADTDDEFDFQDEGDSANTKLDLARAYIDMGDADGARDILKEVLDEGNADQQQKAQSMLESL